MAEGAGFEPAVGVNLRTLSKRVPSTTQPPLRQWQCGRARAHRARANHQCIGFNRFPVLFRDSGVGG